MTGYIGCTGLIALVLFIVLLALWARKSRKGVGQFYAKYGLHTVSAPPTNVLEAIGTPVPLCLEGKIVADSGGEVRFLWMEWSASSIRYTGTTVQGAISCFLAISFAPGEVGIDFENKTIAAKNAKTSLLYKLKHIFALDTRTPTRMEKLADGTFIVFWQVVQRPSVMEEKIAWLRATLSAASGPVMQDVTKPDPTPTLTDPGDQMRPAKEKGKAVFYKHDNYAAIRRRFTEAWPNLEFELHHWGPRLDKEGRDDFDDDAIFAAPGGPDAMVLELSGETIVGTAEQILSDQYGGQAFILRNYVSVERGETLEYCNEPFILPLDRYTYQEFKKRFTARWSNLSIELYDTSPLPGGLGKQSCELADNFDMAGSAHTGDPLHDYIFISDWGASLGRGTLLAAIRNERLGIYCDGNWVYQRLKNFQAAEAAPGKYTSQ